jgi:MFS family permease
MTRAKERLGRDYYTLWTASAISNVGDGVRLTAMPLLAAFVTRDPLAVSIVTVAGRLPWLVFSVLGGAIADRFERIALMRIVQTSRMLVMAGLAATVAWGADGTGILWPLYVGSFLIGISETIYDTAAAAALPSLVEKQQLERANGRLFATELLANEFAGPPIGAFLFAVALALPFVFDSVTFGVAVLLLLTIRTKADPRSEAEPPQKMLRSIGEGLRWAWSSSVLRAGATVAGVFNLTFSGCWAIAVLFILQILDGDETTYGTLLAIMAVAQAAGLILGDRIVKRIGRARIMFLGPAVSAISVAVIGLTSHVIVFAAAASLLSFFIGLWNVVAQSIIQRIVPERLRGRVMGSYRVISWGGLSIGALLGGIVAGGFGLRAPWFMAAVSQVIMSFFALRVITEESIARAEAAAEGATSG